jgi:DNA-binding transcriptional ArsR family regulator
MNFANPALLDAKVQMFKALAHPTRLWIVEQLSTGEQCVCEFVHSLDYDFSTISKHLSVLKQAGIISDEKRGKQVFYQLKIPCIMDFIGCIQTAVVLQNHALMQELNSCTIPTKITQNEARNNL